MVVIVNVHYDGECVVLWRWIWWIYWGLEGVRMGSVMFSYSCE